MREKRSHQSATSRLKRFIIAGFFFGCALLGIGMVALWGLGLYVETQLPEVGSFDQYRRKTPQVSRVLAADGTVIGEFFEERRTVVASDDIPAHVKKAAVAAEDGDFYSHDGLDWLGMVRAFWINVRDGRFSQGGSTITQQLARALHLGQEKTLWRKVRELFLARQLDARLSKDEIIVLYLNQIYFGRGRYGIEEASRVYLGKGVRALTVGDAALLMGLVPSPERLNPFTDYSRSIERRDRVLDRMVVKGFLGAQEAAQIKRTKPSLASRYLESVPEWRSSRWYVDAVRRRLVAQLGKDTLKRGGLRIYTPMDRHLQQRLEAALDPGQQTHGPQAAGVFIRLDNREVVALSGARPGEKGHFNRAIQARRQAGSLFKPLVYGAGVDNGLFHTATRIPNTPLAMRGARGTWRPKNAGGTYSETPVSIGEALEQSYNVVAVRALRSVGIPAAVDFARRAGIVSPMPVDLTLALGNVALSPLEIANTYATMGAGGVVGDPVFVRRVEDLDGAVVFADRSRIRRAFSHHTSRLLAAWLQRVVDAGTGRRAHIPGLIIAGKTGTSNRGVDAWFAGFTQDLAGAVWVGHDSGKPMPNASGGKLAAPIFSAVVKPEPPAIHIETTRAMLME